MLPVRDVSLCARQLTARKLLSHLLHTMAQLLPIKLQTSNTDVEAVLWPCSQAAQLTATAKCSAGLQGNNRLWLHILTPQQAQSVQKSTTLWKMKNFGFIWKYNAEMPEITSSSLQIAVASYNQIIITTTL